MAYSYKGAISFGLIYIPITLFPAVKNNDVSFNLLEKNTLSRIKYQKTCVDCDNKIIEQKDIVKGYEYEDGKYVTFTDEDFEKIKSKKDKNITIEQFVDLSEIDPLYYDKCYYVVPTGAEKAYSLLVKAMSDAKKTGLAKAVLGNKESLIALRVRDNGLILNTLFFHEEIQANPAPKAAEDISGKELSMAKLIVENMSEPLKIENYKDEYRQKIQDAIEQKIAGKEIEPPKEIKKSKVLDLMEALELSLKETSKKAVN
jgi:DNA end-binding protein Ku